MKRLYLFTFLVTTGIFFAQGQQVTQKNYKSAVSFMYNNYNNKTAFNLFTNVYWFEDNSGIWFVDYNKERSTYKTVNFKKKKVELLFNHKKLAQTFNNFLEQEMNPNWRKP